MDFNEKSEDGMYLTNERRPGQIWPQNLEGKREQDVKDETKPAGLLDTLERKKWSVAG